MRGRNHYVSPSCQVSIAAYGREQPSAFAMKNSPLSTGKQSFVSNGFHQQRVPLTARSGYRNLARRRDIMIAATHEPLFGQDDDTPLFQNRKLQNHTATKACSTSEAWRCDLSYIRVIVVHRNVLCTRIRRVVSPKSVTFRHCRVTHKLVA